METHLKNLTRLVASAKNRNLTKEANILEEIIDSIATPTLPANDCPACLFSPDKNCQICFGDGKVVNEETTEDAEDFLRSIISK